MLLLSGITIEKAQVYSDALKSSDVSWYHDTFGIMHQYSGTLYHPISIWGEHRHIRTYYAGQT